VFALFEMSLSSNQQGATSLEPRRNWGVTLSYALAQTSKGVPSDAGFLKSKSVDALEMRGFRRM
jgi:hypothetical protein